MQGQSGTFIQGIYSYYGMLMGQINMYLSPEYQPHVRREN